MSIFLVSFIQGPTNSRVSLPPMPSLFVGRDWIHPFLKAVHPGQRCRQPSLCLGPCSKTEEAARPAQLNCNSSTGLPWESPLTVTTLTRPFPSRAQFPKPQPSPCADRQVSFLHCPIEDPVGHVPTACLRCDQCEQRTKFNLRWF